MSITEDVEKIMETSGEYDSHNLAPMNKKVKRKWLAALRSGNYEQTRGFMTTVELRDGEAHTMYCTMGLLESVVMGRKHMHTFSCIDHDLVKKAGLTMLDANLIIELNDKYKRTFEEIADFIEAAL